MTKLEAIKVIIDDALYNPEAAKIAIEAITLTDAREKADGCMSCEFCDTEEWEMPCAKCKRNCRDYWRAKK